MTLTNEEKDKYLSRYMAACDAAKDNPVKIMRTLTETLPNIFNEIHQKAYDAGFENGKEVGKTMQINRMTKEN